MPIRPPPYPKKVRTSAAAIIKERIAGEPGKARNRREGDLLVLPVYGLPIHALAKGRLEPAALMGWRAIWIERRRRVGATLEFQRTKGGRPRFCSWSFGAKAVDTVKAVVALSRQPVARTQVCRPAVLKVSALQIEAIWLRVSGGPDVMMDLETRLPLTGIQEKLATQSRVPRPRRRSGRLPNRRRRAARKK